MYQVVGIIFRTFEGTKKYAGSLLQKKNNIFVGRCFLFYAVPYLYICYVLIDVLFIT